MLLLDKLLFSMTRVRKKESIMKKMIFIFALPLLLIAFQNYADDQEDIEREEELQAERRDDIRRQEERAAARRDEIQRGEVQKQELQKEITNQEIRKKEIQSDEI